MSAAAPCPACGCVAPAAAHALATLVAVDDLDAALDAGLLDATPCPACAPGCRARLAAARDERLAALAARERFRARTRRLERRAAERQARRTPVAPAGAPAPALPPTAAAVLARALARARRGGP